MPISILKIRKGQLLTSERREKDVRSLTMLLKETSLCPVNHIFPSTVHCRSPEGQDHSQRNGESQTPGSSVTSMVGRESNGRKSLVDFSPEGSKESDTTEATEQAHTFTEYRLNNRGDKVQPCHTPLPVWN